MAFEVLAGGVPPIVMEETPSCAGLRKYFFSPTVEGQVQVPIHSRSGCKENDVLQEVKIIRPNIMYLPSWDTYVNRTNVLLESRAKSTVNNDLPEGFPRAITGPRVWTKDNAPTISELTFPLSDSDVQEIEAALAHYTGQSSPSMFDALQIYPLSYYESMTHHFHLTHLIRTSRG
jgi:hypothetical protein